MSFHVSMSPHGQAVRRHSLTDLYATSTHARLQMVKPHCQRVQPQYLSGEVQPTRRSSEAQSPCNSGEDLQIGAEVHLGEHVFRVTGLLGRGSFSAVWSAVKTNGGLAVAIKQTLCRSEEEVQRAEREARLMQAVSDETKRCPDIIACDTTLGSSGVKRVRIAMVKVPGESITSFLQKRNLSTAGSDASTANQRVREACNFTSALLSQLVASFQSISEVAIHRDISTENVLVCTKNGATNPEFALIDFGLAIEIEKWPTLMKQVSVVGNCFYWPVSAWYIFLHGASKLREHEGMTMEYQNHLDMHALGILALQILMDMIPRTVSYKEVPGLIALRKAWSKFKADANRFWEPMLRASQGNGDWKMLRQTYIQDDVPHVIEEDLAQVRQALADIGDACLHVESDSPLGHAGPLFEALARLISQSGVGFPNYKSTTWASVQAIFSKKEKEVPPNKGSPSETSVSLQPRKGAGPATPPRHPVQKQPRPVTLDLDTEEQVVVKRITFQSPCSKQPLPQQEITPENVSVTPTTQHRTQFADVETPRLKVFAQTPRDSGYRSTVWKENSEYSRIESGNSVAVAPKVSPKFVTSESSSVAKLTAKIPQVQTAKVAKVLSPQAAPKSVVTRFSSTTSEERHLVDFPTCYRTALCVA